MGQVSINILGNDKEKINYRVTDMFFLARRDMIGGGYDSWVTSGVFMLCFGDIRVCIVYQIAKS